MRAWLILIIAFLLMAAQEAVLVLGLFAPDVSPQYRAFFIDKTITDWVREPPRHKPLL